MKRRVLLFGATGLLAPLARAQTSAKPRRVGWLTAGTPKSHAKVLEAFREGMRERGWVEGRNMTLELRWADKVIE